MSVFLLALPVIVAYALWQRKALVAMGASALLFALLGITLSLLAAYGRATDTMFGYIWGGLPQATYDAPFIIAFIIALAIPIRAIMIVGRRLDARRIDQAALAPAEAFSSAKLQNR